MLTVEADTGAADGTADTTIDAAVGMTVDGRGVDAGQTSVEGPGFHSAITLSETGNC